MRKGILILAVIAAAFAHGQSARLGSLGRNDMVVTNPAPFIAEFAATGTVARASSYGTPNRWVDATGCVWVATADKAPWTGGPSSPLLWSDDHGGWISNPSTDLLTWSSGTWQLASGTLTTTFTCSGEWDAMRLVLHNEGDGTVILERGLLTNFVGRVALTNDIPDVSGYATPADVTAAIREQSLGGIYDSKLGVWWTPHMANGAYYWTATTNVNLNAEGN